MSSRDLSASVIHTRDLLAVGHTAASIRRELRAGRLFRLRRGAYCESALWRSLDPADQHVLRAAVVCSEVEDAMLCGISAAAVWGMPLIVSWPDEVSLLTRYRGGGTSEPGVRRTVVGARDAPVTSHRGLPLTSPARTAIDLASGLGFRSGVVAMDWLLARGLERDDLFTAISSRTSRRGRAAALAAAEFADAGSESPGESVARAAIFEAGFVVPELQHELRDAEGTMRLDFWWPGVDVAGEFDGRVKYGAGFQEGLEPTDAVWREKRREDRVRRRAAGVVRLVWSDLWDRDLLVSLLEAAGVPRRQLFVTGPRSLRSDPDAAGSERT